MASLFACLQILVVVRLVVSASAIDCLARLLSKMTKSMMLIVNQSINQEIFNVAKIAISHY